MHEFGVVCNERERAFIKEKQLRGEVRGSSPTGQTRSTFGRSSIWLMLTILETSLSRASGVLSGDLLSATTFLFCLQSFNHRYISLTTLQSYFFAVTIDSQTR